LRIVSAGRGERKAAMRRLRLTIAVAFDYALVPLGRDGEMQ
jgi:hypothetical protein